MERKLKKNNANSIHNYILFWSFLKITNFLLNFRNDQLFRSPINYFWHNYHSLNISTELSFAWTFCFPIKMVKSSLFELPRLNAEFNLRSFSFILIVDTSWETNVFSPDSTIVIISVDGNFSWAHLFFMKSNEKNKRSGSCISA